MNVYIARRRRRNRLRIRRRDEGEEEEEEEEEEEPVAKRHHMVNSILAPLYTVFLLYLGYSGVTVPIGDKVL